jgi:hypothetical protein
MKRPNYLPRDDDQLSLWLVIFAGFGCCVLVGLIAWAVLS